MTEMLQVNQLSHIYSHRHIHAYAHALNEHQPALVEPVQTSTPSTQPKAHHHNNPESHTSKGYKRLAELSLHRERRPDDKHMSGFCSPALCYTNQTEKENIPRRATADRSLYSQPLVSLVNDDRFKKSKYGNNSSRRSFNVALSAK